jgi:indolepyruvate ferredoxin oxidoreductase
VGYGLCKRGVTTASPAVTSARDQRRPPSTVSHAACHGPVQAMPGIATSTVSALAGATCPVAAGEGFARKPATPARRTDSAMAIDPRFLTGSGREVFNGNELLVKGCLEVEGGVHLYTGYPGSPVATFFDVLGDVADLLKKNGVRAHQANNEALSVAALNGSQMAPLRGITAFKSVGLHVASDALCLGNLAGAHTEGGAVVVCGDDPWCDSTQVPADSRFLCEHLRMPVVEPGTIQELKDFIDLSFKLSRQAELFVGYIVTTLIADGGGTVECKPNQFPAISTKQKIQLETANIDLGKVLLPPKTVQKELTMPDRHARAITIARDLGLNWIERTVASDQWPVDRNASSSLATGHSQLATPVAPLGFITTGVMKSYLDQVLGDVGLAGMFPVLHFGMQYPMDIELVRQFARQCRTMIVLEERRSFVEKLIRDALFKALPGTDQPMPMNEAVDIAQRLFGKAFPNGRPGVPETRGLNPSILAQLLIPLIETTEEIPAEQRNGNLSAEMELIKLTGKRKLAVVGSAAATAAATLTSMTAPSHGASDTIAEKLVTRSPTFCPGCPHRDSSGVLLEIRKNLADATYMQRTHGRGPVDLVAHGDTGCYTMLMYAPTEQLMHNYSGMGLGGGTGSGIDPFITNKQIVFMGDGTFFHSGAIAISNAVKAGQDITFIILENGTTAMTGHQEHPGTELDVLGNRSFIQDIESVVRAMKGTSPLQVVKMRPDDRAKYKKTLEKTILADGVKVVIADKECGITYHRRKGKEERKLAKANGGFLPTKTQMNITPEVCEHCLECTKATACPGLTKIDTDYGPKVDTDLSLCVNDGACDRVRTSNDFGTSVKPCPSFEQITITRKRRGRYRLPNLRLTELPEPEFVHDMAAAGKTWRVHMAGVGGMGIGLTSAILVRAGHKEGYRVVFADKKGLAIRNGGVYSQISWIKEGESAAPVAPQTCGLIPYGKADLLLGMDILEAARAIDPRDHFRVASPNRTAAILNLHKQPTVGTLIGRHDFSPEALRDEIVDHCNKGYAFARDLSDLCEQRLGSKQFLNIMMLGVAYQMGLIPVHVNNIAWAIRDTIRRDQRKNLKAFNIGRKIAAEPHVLPPKPEPKTWQQLLTQKTKIIRKFNRKGPIKAGMLETFTKQAMEWMPNLPEASKYDLALRIYDIYQWGKLSDAERYVDLVRGIYRRDSADQKYAATHAVIWNLAKAMLVKDEPYVAYLLTRPEKKQRDIQKYNVDVANGDGISYRWHNVPEIPIPLVGKVRLNVTTRPWMHRVLRHFKFVRQLPGWHKREFGFRDWYVELLGRVNLSDATHYRRAVEALKCVEEVTGYREVRYPKMEAAKQKVEQILAEEHKVELTVRRDVLQAFAATKSAEVAQR